MRTRVAAAGAILFGLGFGLLPLGHGAGYVAATIVVWTFGEMLVFPSLMTLMSLRAPAGSQGRYQGLHSLAYSVGCIVAWELFHPSGGRLLVNEIAPRPHNSGHLTIDACVTCSVGDPPDPA